MYARVITPGEVRTGRFDRVLPLAPDNDPDRWIRLFEVDVAEAEADLRLGGRARGGLEIDFVDADELVMSSSGRRRSRRSTMRSGCGPCPSCCPSCSTSTASTARKAASGSSGRRGRGPSGASRLRVLGGTPPTFRPGRAAARGSLPSLAWTGRGRVWADVVVPVFRDVGFEVGVWKRLLPHLLATRSVSVVIAEREGRPVGCGLLSTLRKIALLRTGLVLPEARGHGIQRALIRARIQRALDDGCRVVAAHAGAGTLSERNLVASGLRRTVAAGRVPVRSAQRPGTELSERAVVA